MRHLPTYSLFSLCALIGLIAALAACDSLPAGEPPPPEMPVLSAEAAARVAEVFEEAEALFSRGTTAALGKQHDDLEALLAMTPEQARAALTADTARFTGIYDATSGRGYLATLRYRRPLGADLWQVTLQAGREVTPGTFAVETLTASFYDHASMAAFLAEVQNGANAYLAGTSQDALAAFAPLDVWRLSRLYSPAPGQAVVTYTTDEMREQYTLRDPVVTLSRDGTCTVRDGGPAGSVRTRYYESDCAAAADGTVAGTLHRTLSTSGDATGAITSRTDFATGAWRLVSQRGGDGVVIRSTAEG